MSINYIAIAARTDIAQEDKTKVKLKLKNDFSDVTEINVSDLPLWRQIADHSKEWRVVCFAVDVGTVKKLGLSKADIDTWKQNQLTNPNRVQVLACGMNPKADLEASGIEPIPVVFP